MKMTKGVIIGLVGAILVVVATILPWASSFGVGGISIGDISGLFTGFGDIVLIIGIIGLVLALLGRGVGSIVCGVLALVVSLLWVGAWSIVAGFINITGSDNAVGYGTYIAIIGSIILIVGGALMMGEKKAAPAVAAPPPVAPPMQ